MTFPELLIWLAILFGVALLIFFYKIGIFSRVSVTPGEYQGGHFIYVEYAGDYRRINQEFAKINPQLQKLEKEFVDIVRTGLYFNDLRNITEADTCMAALGGIIDQKYTIEEIHRALAGTEFKYKQLPPTKCVRSVAPYITFLSYLIMHKRIWRALHNWLNTFKDEIADAIVACEVYNWSEHIVNQTTELILLFGKAVQPYKLHSSLKVSASQRTKID